MWYNWLLLYTEWLRRRCYCFVRSCCYKRDYPVGMEEPAQGMCISVFVYAPINLGDLDILL